MSPNSPRSFHLSLFYLQHLLSDKSRSFSTSLPYLPLKPGVQGYGFSPSPDYKTRWSASGEPLLITKGPSPALSQGRSPSLLPSILFSWIIVLLRKGFEVTKCVLIIQNSRKCGTKHSQMLLILESTCRTAGLVVGCLC